MLKARSFKELHMCGALRCIDSIRVFYY